MNTTEGVHRITAAIRWCGNLTIAFGGVAVLYNVATRSTSSDHWIALGIAGVLGGLAHLLAWIIDGFVAPKID